MAKNKELSYEEIIEKIMEKKEFSGLPKKDVELVYESFDKPRFLVEEKIKLTRDLLRKMYTAFVSEKLLSIKDKEPEWFLKKHISTKERFLHYELIYLRSLSDLMGEINVFDLGSGINGFSYEYFEKAGFNVNYFGLEAVGQLVDLQNYYFEKNKNRAICVHESLFNLDFVKNFVLRGNGKRVVFLFKALDSLEMLKRDYSKELLNSLVPLVDRVVVSWATRSLVSKKKFHAKRSWLKNFIEENFQIIEEFEVGGENYLIFEKKELNK